MKLIGNLKKKVEKADSMADAKRIIGEAGMELTDEEMEGVTGGVQFTGGTGSRNVKVGTKGSVGGNSLKGDGSKSSLTNNPPLPSGKIRTDNIGQNGGWV